MVFNCAMPTEYFLQFEGNNGLICHLVINKRHYCMYIGIIIYLNAVPIPWKVDYGQLQCEY